jgi:hypothetical protein
MHGRPNGDRSADVPRDAAQIAQAVSDQPRLEEPLLRPLSVQEGRAQRGSLSRHEGRSSRLEQLEDRLQEGANRRRLSSKVRQASLHGAASPALDGLNHQLADAARRVAIEHHYLSNVRGGRQSIMDHPPKARGGRDERCSWPSDG